MSLKSECTRALRSTWVCGALHRDVFIRRGIGHRFPRVLCLVFQDTAHIFYEYEEILSRDIRGIYGRMFNKALKIFLAFVCKNTIYSIYDII